MKEIHMKETVKNISIIIGIYVLIGVALPFIFKYVIFESNEFSNLNNAEWAGFLGSYVGGILGGLGTLIAVFITVKDSKEAQIKNEQDTIERIEADRKERNRERDEDKLQEIMKEKNRFAISIAEYIGKYVTHISKYYYANLYDEITHEKYLDAREKLIVAETEIDRIYKKINDEDSDSKKIIQLGLKKDQLLNKKQKLKREYEEKRYDDQKNREEGDRTVANECFFTLKTMLHGIHEADIMKSKLNEIHNGFAKASRESLDQRQLVNNIDELMKIYDTFKDDYLAAP